MSRNNTIGIVGYITAPPKLTVDAEDWKKRVYETTLSRTRPSDVEDTYILRFDGRAAGTEEMLKGITEGVEVLIGGEIRSENVHNPQPGENRVKIYINAEVIAVNIPPANAQNEVEIRGRICKPPHFRITPRETLDGKKIAVTNIMVAVSTPTNTSYIPCACFGWKAFWASTFKVNDYVEIYGHFLSRNFKKRIAGRELPLLCTAHEICVAKLENKSEYKRNRPEREGGEGT